MDLVYGPLGLGVVAGLGCGLLLGWHLRARLGQTSKRLITAMGNGSGEATVMGEGGQDEKDNCYMNFMQMLHGAYNIQNYYEQDNMKQLWTYLDDATSKRQFKKLQEPVLTRWWLVGACACSLRESITQWKKFAMLHHLVALPAESPVAH